MDEFNYIQFLNDDNELLQVEDVQLGDFPTFSLHFDEFFGDFSVISTQDPCDLESSKKRNKRKQDNNKSRANTRSRCFQVSCSFK